MKRRILLAAVLAALMTVGLSVAGLAAPAPVLQVGGSGSIELSDGSIADITIDAQTLGKPETRTWDTPAGTVYYDVYKCKGFVNISVEDAGLSFKARVEEMYALWEGVHGVSITYKFKGVSYAMYITDNAYGDYAWLAPLPMIAIGGGESPVTGDFTVVVP